MAAIPPLPDGCGLYDTQSVSAQLVGLHSAACSPACLLTRDWCGVAPLFTLFCQARVPLFERVDHHSSLCFVFSRELAPNHENLALVIEPPCQTRVIIFVRRGSSSNSSRIAVINVQKYAFQKP